MDDLQAHKVEVELRGIYMSYACDIEYLLTDLICNCFAKSEQDRDAMKVIFFERLTMGTKISIAKKTLKNYSEIYFESMKEAFQTFEDLSALRNLFAHSRITNTDNQDGIHLQFEYIKKGEQKKELKNINNLSGFLYLCRPQVMNLANLVVVIYNETSWVRKN
jgi:hypothetical protein